jgi:uncharacterized damage-inducible protein DinB
LAALKAEKSGEPSTRSQLLNELCEALKQAEARVCALAKEDFETPRTVGRKQLPITLGGALIHVADHTQRHVGQVVTTAKVIRALAGG